MATFPNLPDPGDTHTIAGVTFTWTEYLNNIGFWLKENASLLQTSVGDTRVLFTEGTNVVGSPYLTYDMDAADPLEMVFTVSSTDASSTIFDMVKFIDKDGLASNVLQSNGLWKGFDNVGTPFSELADNNFYARKNGAWQILSTTGNAVTLGTAVPTHPTYGNASGDLFIHTSSEQIYTFDGGSTWTKQFGINRELSTDAAGAVVAPYTNGDMWINEATGSLFAAAASSWIAIGGPAALDLKVNRAPTASAESTITSNGANFCLSLVSTDTGEHLFQMTDRNGDRVWRTSDLGVTTIREATVEATTLTISNDPAQLSADEGMIHIALDRDQTLVNDSVAISIKLDSTPTLLPNGIYIDASDTSSAGTDANRNTLAGSSVFTVLGSAATDTIDWNRDGRLTIRPDLEFDGTVRDVMGVHVNASDLDETSNSFQLIRSTLPAATPEEGANSEENYYFGGVLGNTTVFRVLPSGEVWNTGNIHTSDVSTKSNIHYQTPDSKSTTSATVPYSGLDLLDGLSVASFTSDYDASSRERLGLIAQDVTKKIPEAVVTGADGLEGIDYAALTAVLINAVRELKDRIEVLEA